MNFVDSLKRWFYTNNSSAAGSAARIPLLDANGVAVGSDTYNAISEIVRQELGKILNGGTAQTTGITKVPSLVGNALGATTIANLASVLGAPTYISLNNGDDLNDCVTVGALYGTPNVTVLNKPAGTSEFLGIWAVKQGAENRYIQFLTDYNDLGQNRLFYRQKFPAGNWGDWHEISYNIPDFYKGYSTLASLASAVGVHQKATVAANSTYSLAPSMTTGTAIVTIYYGGYTFIQVATITSGNFRENAILGTKADDVYVSHSGDVLTVVNNSNNAVDISYIVYGE